MNRLSFLMAELLDVEPKSVHLVLVHLLHPVYITAFLYELIFSQGFIYWTIFLLFRMEQ